MYCRLFCYKSIVVAFVAIECVKDFIYNDLLNFDKNILIFNNTCDIFIKTSIRKGCG